MKQSFPAGFASMVRSGLVTHMVANPESVDQVFAIAKAKDLPEVRFAAAFDDGSLLLGCPNGLPMELADMAEAIDPLAMDEEVADESPATEAAEIPAQTGADDGISAKLDALMQAVKDVPTPLDLSDQFEQLRSTLSSDAGPTDDMGARLDALSAKLDIAAELNERISQLETAIATNHHELGAAVEAMNSHEPTAGTTAQIEALQDAMVALTAQIPQDRSEAIEDALERVQGLLTTGSDTSFNPADVEFIKSGISQLVEAQSVATSPQPVEDEVDSPLPEIQATLSEILAALNGLSDTPAPVETSPVDPSDIAAIKENLEQLISNTAQSEGAPSAPINDPATMERLEQIDSALGQLLSSSTELGPIKDATAQILEALEKTDENLVTDVEASSDPVGETLSALQAQLAELLAKPDPEMPQPDLSPVLDAIQGLDDQLSGQTNAAPETHVDLAPIQTALDQITEMLAATPAAPDTSEPISVETSPDDEPNAEVDLTPLLEGQDRLLATVEPLAQLDSKVQAVAAQVATLAKLRGAAEAPAAAPEPQILPVLEAGLAKLESMMAANAEPSSDTDETLRQIIDHLSRMETKLDGEGSADPAQDALLAQLRSAITSLENMPAPVLDLTPQRRSFAQFGTALSTAIGRLERVTDNLSDVPDVAPAPANEGTTDVGTSEETTFEPEDDALVEDEIPAGEIEENQLPEDADVEDEMDAGDNEPVWSSRRGEDEVEDELAQSFGSEEPDPAAFDPDALLEMEKLRGMFAELIAQQIRENAEKQK